MVRLEQSINGLVIQALVLQRHPHFACKWAERAVVKLDHSVTPFAFNPRRLGSCARRLTLARRGPL
jgi:hypothetical protein